MSKRRVSLPNKDMLVDAIAGYSTFCFMDELGGYNQIKMNPCDAEKTAFRTSTGNFHYTAMSFGLKNVSATYHRVMTTIVLQYVL